MPPLQPARVCARAAERSIRRTGFVSRARVAALALARSRRPASHYSNGCYSVAAPRSTLAVPCSRSRPHESARAASRPGASATQPPAPAARLPPKLLRARATVAPAAVALHIVECRGSEPRQGGWVVEALTRLERGTTRRSQKEKPEGQRARRARCPSVLRAGAARVGAGGRAEEAPRAKRGARSRGIENARTRAARGNVPLAVHHRFIADRPEARMCGGNAALRRRQSA